MNEIITKTIEHIELTIISLITAMILSVPLGIVIARSKSKWASLFLRFAAMIQTIPGLALIALTVVLLAATRSVLPVPVTGVLPSVIVLVLYALLPILSNTVAGIRQVSVNIKNVANAMGMTPRQILFFVELPLSLPVLINGVRVALVSTIGMVTLTSMVGSGGLGDLIIQGLRTMQWNPVIAGTVPAVVLAILFDTLLSKIEGHFRSREILS